MGDPGQATGQTVMSRPAVQPVCHPEASDRCHGGAQGRDSTRDHSPHPVFLQKEERTMLEDIWVALSELESVTFSFKQLDENYVASECPSSPTAATSRGSATTQGWPVIPQAVKPPAPTPMQASELDWGREHVAHTPPPSPAALRSHAHPYVPDLQGRPSRGRLVGVFGT